MGSVVTTIRSPKVYTGSHGNLNLRAMIVITIGYKSESHSLIAADGDDGKRSFGTELYLMTSGGGGEGFSTQSTLYSYGPDTFTITLATINKPHAGITI